MRSNKVLRSYVLKRNAEKREGIVGQSERSKVRVFQYLIIKLFQRLPKGVIEHIERNILTLSPFLYTALYYLLGCL